MPEPAIDQCDGCARGLPVDENGLHYQSNEQQDILYYVMGCTKERYKPKQEPQ